MKKVNPSPGYYIVEQLVIKPKETIGKSNIINPNAELPPEKFHQVEERFDEHPWQGIVRYAGPNTQQVEMIYKPGDHVYLKTDVSMRNVVLIDTVPMQFIPQGDIICSITKSIENE